MYGYTLAEVGHLSVADLVCEDDREALAKRLQEKATPYAAPMRILADLAGAGGEAFEIAPADDPDDLAALDAAWEEEQVRFDGPAAPGAADCPQVAGMVDRMLAQEPVRSQIHG